MSAVTGPLVPGIGEEELAKSAPLVRAEVVRRLEEVWATCEPHVRGQVPRPDPRFVEIGVRVLDRLTNLYRLNAPARSDDGKPATAIDSVALVLGKLQELEARQDPGSFQT